MSRRSAWRVTVAALAALALAGLQVALAQPRLIVNGRTIEGNTTALVSGVSYAPAGPLASALGATAAVDTGRSLVVLDAGGRFLQLQIAGSPEAATTVEGAMRLDGTVVPGPAAVASGGDVYLPVKQVAEALGASVTFVASEGTVIVVQPRARLTGMRVLRSPERLELSLSRPVRYSVFYNEPVQTLQVYFERTDVEVRLTPVEGERFVVAAALPSSGGVDARVQMREGTSYDVYQVPDGAGFRLVIAFGAAGESPLAEGMRIVIDPGHGGQDTGLVGEAGSESSLTLATAERLAASLRQRGFDVVVTRDGDYTVPVSARSGAGIGADLFISLHAADVPPGTYNAYYLGDATDVDSLDMAIRENAAAATAGVGSDDQTDRLRRELLLGLVPDLEAGRSYAEALGSRLFTIGDYRAGQVAAAPLQVLGGAAGRGVLLEFAPSDLASGELSAVLTEAVADLLAQVMATDGR
ncbi:MAG TPA: N-acetylmuramoyl-L-alanine amidase [Trueperaceae bacterium]